MTRSEPPTPPSPSASAGVAGHTATATGYYARAGRILRATVQADHPMLRIGEDALAALAGRP